MSLHVPAKFNRSGTRMITTTAPCGVKPRSKKSRIGKPQVIPRCISQLDDTALTGWEHSRLAKASVENIIIWPMKKSFHKKIKLLQFDTFFYILFCKISWKIAGTSKNLSKWSRYFILNRNIAWLALTGIQFPNGRWVSGMEISSSCGLKKP